jgi:hypothetical protein
MQCDLMDACEVCCTGENLSPFVEGTQSTNKNENRCRYGAVVSVMAGQMLTTSSNWNIQACPA